MLSLDGMERTQQRRAIGPCELPTHVFNKQRRDRPSVMRAHEASNPRAPFDLDSFFKVPLVEADERMLIDTRFKELACSPSLPSEQKGRKVEPVVAPYVTPVLVQPLSQNFGGKVWQYGLHSLEVALTRFYRRAGVVNDW